ncbi:MAG: ABC transporter permease [Thauera sp.]
MKPLLALAWASLGARRFVALLTVACIGLGSAVLIVVEQMRAQAREAFTRSVSGVDLIVGPRGGSVELLMGVVFRTGTPGSGMAFETYRKISALPGVAWAVPVSFGDSHRGFPVMGTDAGYFQHFRYGRAQPLAFASGMPFADVYDAVIGAEVAQRLGYKLNDALELEHGLQQSMGAGHDHEDKPFRVVGVLELTGTAVDRTVHVSLQGIEAMHVDWQAGRPPVAGEKLSAEEARVIAKAPERISAMLLATDQRAAALFLQQRIVNWPSEPLSAVLPGPALLELWDIVGVAENVLRGMSWGVIAVVLVGMLTVLWSGLEERRREMAVLRAVGARPRHVFVLIVGEAFLLTLGGVALGAVIATASLWLLEGALVQRYGLSLSGPSGVATMVPVLAGLLAAGLVAGLLPAWRCYHRSLSDGLSPDVGG